MRRVALLILLCMHVLALTVRAQERQLYVDDVEIDATLSTLVALPSIDHASKAMVDLRLTFEAAANVPDALVLVCEGLAPDTLEIVHTDTNGVVQRERSGRSLGVHQRSVPIGGTLVRLPSYRGAPLDITIRTRAYAVGSLIVRSLAMHERWTTTRQLIISMLYGLMTMSVVMTIVFFFTFRDASYLWYVGFLLSYLLMLITEDGRWVFTSALADVPVLRAVSPAFKFAALATALQFSRRFLNVASWSRRIDRVYVGMIVMTLLVAVAALVPLPALHMVGQFGTYTVFLLVGLLFLSSGIGALRKGHRLALYYLSAWSAIALAAVLAVAVYVLGIDTSRSQFLRATFGSAMIVHVGAGIEVIMLTLGVAARLRAQRRSDELLRAMLPSAIVERMRDRVHIADDLQSVTVLFCDIVGFTALSGTVDAEHLVRRLDDVFGMMDACAKKHGVEKIKTIGDAYMAVAGAPEHQPDHADRAIRFALDVLDAIKRDHGDPHIDVRIGIHTGPVIAGVLGTWKFGYDVWGQTVNVASRLEQKASPGTALISAATLRAAVGTYTTKPLGMIELRGVGTVEGHLLHGPDPGP